MRWLTYFLIGSILLVATSCKDSAKEHEAATVEKCQVHMDNGEWTDAIDSCSTIKTDEGYHLTAQAYLARGGAGLLSILTASSEGSSTLTGLFDSIPDTAAKKSDVLAGLGYLTLIEAPEDIVYAEGLLGSALLILSELTDLMALELAADGSITHCASDGTIDNCSFSLSLSDDTYTADDVNAETGNAEVTATYTGMGTTFYDGLCGQSNEADVHTTYTVTGRDSTDTFDVVITENFTVNSCAATDTSALYYNKWAAAGLADPPEALNALSQLKFYDQIDTGENYSKVISSDSLLNPITISICNKDAIPVTGDEDMAVNDCEVLYFVTNLSLE